MITLVSVNCTVSSNPNATVLTHILYTVLFTK